MHTASLQNAQGTAEHEVLEMLGKFSVVVLGAVSMPVLAQFNPSTSVGQLTQASAQGVLAFVVVAEAVALVLMFRQWHKGIEKDRQEAKDLAKTLTKTISENTAAMGLVHDVLERNNETLIRIDAKVDK